MTSQPRTSILFICMGNICRSPLAEGLFRQKVNEGGVAERFTIDSAGTGGWHAGEPPDHRMRETAKRYGVTLAGRARQVTNKDFEQFDHLICMDADNRDIILDRGAPPEKVSLLLEYDKSSRAIEVPDPYYGGEEGFELVYRLVDSACDALLSAALEKSKSQQVKKST